MSQLQIAANLIHVLGGLLGVYGFLFLSNLDGKCMLFIVQVTYQKLPNK